ncbi:hypothetical protein [Methylobacterium sp. WSM2598]|uniref:hypothetical protein n=1 Tax=Methylobacterium sp. WSM2598 TaxID=398261 RepID=UPI0003634CD8|nr:hypothetical protein [Methylobacterium sp. WSM2598]
MLPHLPAPPFTEAAPGNDPRTRGVAWPGWAPGPIARAGRARIGAIRDASREPFPSALPESPSRAPAIREARHEPSLRARRILLFVNIAHALDHFVLLIDSTAVTGIAAATGLSYGALIGLATGSVVAFGLCALTSPAAPRRARPRPRDARREGGRQRRHGGALHLAAAPTRAYSLRDFLGFIVSGFAVPMTALLHHLVGRLPAGAGRGRRRRSRDLRDRGGVPHPRAALRPAPAAAAE